MNLWQIRHIPNTWPNFFNLTLAACFALLSVWYVGYGVPYVQGQSDSKTSSAKTASSDAASAAAATEFFKKVHQSLYGHASIKADIEQTVAIGNQQFLASGHYLSQGSKLRLEYTIKPDQGVSGELVEICDGNDLWSLIHVLENKRVTHRDVKQIKAKMAETRTVTDAVLTGELGLGGLAGLLASLERSMIFDVMKEENGESGARTIIQGKWKPEVQSRWPKDKGDSLPAYIPDLVQITVDSQTLFPIRIVYAKRTQDKDKKGNKPLVSLKFRNVEFDQAIGDEEFTFTPPAGVIPEDVTRQYLDRIKVSADAAAAGANPAQPAPK